MVRSLAPILLLCMVLFGTVAAGCDLLGPDGQVYAGAVVEAGTDTPVEGIEVSFQSIGGFGGTTGVTATLTDAQGRFRLRSAGEYPMFVNSPACYGAVPCPYNPAYIGSRVAIGSQNRKRLRIELERRSAMR